MKVAIIPARGGSKRIPKKNIKEFNGKPVIAWSIIAAQESMLFDHIIVSTDDEEIKSISENYGAKAPFYRPSKLSDDYTATAPVIAHAINKLNRLFEKKVSYACCIYPCSPMLKASNLINAFNILEESKQNFVYPVTEFSHSIYRSMIKNSKGKMEFLYPNHEQTRTQDLVKTFHDAGQFYWGRADAWLKGRKMHTDAVGMEIPSYLAADIDTIDDWKRAELLYQLEQFQNFNK
jgi:pseudaminic acid cytidylyltransferase